MALKSLFQYINIKPKKEATAEEKQQAIQLTCNMAQEMRVLLTNSYLVKEIISKAEQHIFEHKKVLMLNTYEYETLYKMLELITTISAQSMETVDRIILLLNSE